MEYVNTEPEDSAFEQEPGIDETDETQQLLDDLMTYEQETGQTFETV